MIKVESCKTNDTIIAKFQIKYLTFFLKGVQKDKHVT